ELKEDKFNEIYPVNVFGYEMTTKFFLVHLATHLNYHL
ncbi:DinB superfamily protein, partial [bacterium BMS3Abin03]|nr:DinB superfamily protein [bacterium BMS3Abin03]